MPGIIAGGNGRTRSQVDFRYGGVCLMLMLDGHVESQSRFEHLTDGPTESDDWDDLEQDRRVRVLNLTGRWLTVGP